MSNGFFANEIVRCVRGGMGLPDAARQVLSSLDGALGSRPTNSEVIDEVLAILKDEAVRASSVTL
jgi:hypothetical protein